jgi:hypothetical protein
MGRWVNRVVAYRVVRAKAREVALASAWATEQERVLAMGAMAWEAEQARLAQAQGVQNPNKNPTTQG